MQRCAGKVTAEDIRLTTEYGLAWRLQSLPDEFEFKSFEEKFPLTCEYMENFYTNYEYAGLDY